MSQGWIRWNGKGIRPKGIVDYELRDGTKEYNVDADNLIRWSHMPKTSSFHSRDIIRYRMSKI